MHGLNVIDSEKGGGISSTPGVIREGGNSGFQAMGLAIHFGASRVYLLGYDMKFGNGGRKHWHGDHPSNLGNPVPSFMRQWVTFFAQAERQSPVPILNLTRDTALTLPRADISALTA